MIKLFYIGDKSRYDGETVEIKDVRIKSSLKNGIVEYLVNDGSGDFWVNSGDLDTHPTGVDTDEFFEQDEYSPEIQDLGFSVFGWMDGLENREDNSKLPEIFSYLLAVQYDKEGSYGSSWKGKGEYRGIIPNIDRKYDRLSKIIDDEIDGTRDKLPTKQKLELYEKEYVGESKIDAVADLVNYGLLYLTWFRDNYPGAFKVWIDKNVPVYARDKIPFVQKYYERYKETEN